MKKKTISVMLTLMLSAAAVFAAGCVLSYFLF